MRLKVFRFRQTFNRCAQVPDALGGQFLKRDFFDERIERYAAEIFGKTVGRQSVICA